MKHKGTKQLETNRLILRQFVVKDYELFYKNWATDERVTRYMTWNPHQNIEETKELVTRWSNSYNKNEFYHWIIVLKENNEPAGNNGNTNTIQITLHTNIENTFKNKKRSPCPARHIAPPTKNAKMKFFIKGIIVVIIPNIINSYFQVQPSICNPTHR